MYGFSEYILKISWLLFFYNKDNDVLSMKNDGVLCLSILQVYTYIKTTIILFVLIGVITNEWISSCTEFKMWKSRL